ncbi:T9SS type A sorting domain-containing protein [Flavobacterium sp. xlx-214]|uniref:T9SS type A sorting domain-containing protein n=1 Tax=unclassified Flavobacterium TaxID=196869 RepID=UPI0013D656DE|nr:MULTISPECIES: T9SS type A sorting domain-containing protein [unclassified Flavobacterium]MBA5793483.1 T9SS type A sorting domain-containing protein [Flavobacterium sp. xlx-221]QMI82746.1 T9SS type A sorting domain-containing protein [Flavobacterium sp. xlx-214]
MQILSILFFLSSFFSQAQTYNWKWAMKGGGSIGGTDEEQIYDVKVGTDGNYYFIGTMIGNQSPQLNGQTVTVYNSSMGGNDIFLFSTTCDGTIRWSQAIGGEHDDRAYNLVLDSNNNVYVGAYITSDSNYNIHFSPNPADDIMPLPANPDAHKRIYLVKYDSNGVFQGKKALQGTVSSTNREAQILDLVMDSQNKLHFIVGLLNGTHLDNQVTVPSQYVYDPSTWTYHFQYLLVQYNTNLNYVNSMVLPISDTSVIENGKTRFAYDKTLNRYYLAGEVQNSGQIVYNSKATVNKSFILALNGSNGNEVWRRELYSNPLYNQLANNRFNSLKTDTNSDIYIGGNLWIDSNDQNVKFYDPTNTNVQPYLFTPGADYTIPMIVKLNSSGTVQWVQATSASSPGAPPPGPRQGKGIALNGNEVAFGAQGANEFWDAIEIVRPLTGFQPDPILVRFNKQTGNVIAVHDIYGDSGGNQRMTAVATDNDGNYITAGTFQANLFMNNTLGITPLVSTGQADFFVAKLAASACGSGASTQDFTKLNLKVYPNPTNDIINIETQETLQSYEVYNVLGQQLQKGLFNSNNQINLHGVTAGTYFIKVTTQQGSSATVKVVKL